MYRVSQLPRATIIVADEVIAMGSVGNNPEINNIWKSIITAEERFLKSAMTDLFYYDFRDKKNKVVTEENKTALTAAMNASGGSTVVLKVGEIVNAIEFVEDPWYKVWWNEFGWILAAQAVVYTSTPTNWLRNESAGEMLNNPKTITMDGPKGAQSAELKDVQWKQARLHQDHIDPLIEKSNQWLCKNRAHFPLFKCGGCGSCDRSDSSGVSVKRKSGWVHDIYND